VHLPVGLIEPAPGAASSRDSGAQLRHYKLRDAEGNVIGVAARHELTIGDTAEAAWLLAIPSRGTIALAASLPAAGGIESAVAALGIADGETIDQPLSIDIATPARSVTATGEFAGIDFELLETWVVTGVDENGGIRGSLRLNTIGRQST